MPFNIVLSVVLCVSINNFWLLPEPEMVSAELAPFLQQGESLSEQPASGTALFDEVIAILRRSSEPIRHYLDQCDSLAWLEIPFAKPLPMPQIPLDIHTGNTQTHYLLNALRQYLVQRLVQARLFDEAKKILEELSPENSLDPAGVFVIQAIVFHHFSERKKGLAALEQFQKIAEQATVPRRYTELAKLLQFDWEKKSEEEDTEKIARQMEDVRRRLGKGRTDEDTQETEKDVLQSLEKLIQQIEAQAQQQGQQGEGGQSGNPAEDSFRAKQKGQGNIDRRDFLSGDHWGNLPAKEREEALLNIEKEFPPYYRDIIEQYFREMAK